MKTPIRCCRKQHLIGVFTVCNSSNIILDTSTGRKIDVFKFLDKYGKELGCHNTKSKYDNFMTVVQDGSI